MRVSAKVDYALRAVTELAASPPGFVKAERLATAQEIPLKFLENILLELRRAEIVASQRGAEGGYRLAQAGDGGQPRRRDPRRRGADRDRARRPARGRVVHRRRDRAPRRLDRAAHEHARRARDDVARRSRRAEPPLGEDPLLRGADVDDLAVRELELLALVARQLRPDLLAVGTDELDAHLEAEVDDALDHRLGCVLGRREQELEVVRPHPASRRRGSSGRRSSSRTRSAGSS